MGKHSKPPVVETRQSDGGSYRVAVVIAVLSTVLALAAVGAMCAWRAGLYATPGEKIAASQPKPASQDADAAADGEEQDADAPAEPVETVTIADEEMAPDTRAAEFEVRPGDAPGTDQPSDEKVLYLTFDDGPSHNTERVLEILDRYHAKATFFVTGADPDYAHMIREAYDRGHTIGMHTYTHDYAQVYASTDAYFADLDSIANVVREQIGYVPAFIRFPGGSSNTISANYTRGIMSTLAPEVQERGYQYYDWDASCGDGADHTAEDLAFFATEDSAAVGMPNVIMLLHDSAAKDTTVEALPKIIEYWQAQGYELRALDRNSRYAHHGIGN